MAEIHPEGLYSLEKRLQHKGFAILKHAYTGREINHIKRILNRKFQNEKKVHNKKRLFHTFPDMRQLLFNKNLLRILGAIDPQAFLTKAAFYIYEYKQKDWWQETAIYVKDKIEGEGYEEWKV